MTKESATDVLRLILWDTGICLRAEAVTSGCAMSHALDADTCEIKRVFVTPSARGKGVARQLCTAVMAQARSDGFTRVLLDTSARLTAARALYARMGFTERGPYQPVPDFALPHLVFFEASL